MTDRIRASHILRNLDGRSIEDALKEIKDIKTAIDGGAEFSDQAKLKNNEEDKIKSNIIWRVRGTPKNGLVIKRFTKGNQETTPQ